MMPPIGYGHGAPFARVRLGSLQPESQHGARPDGPARGSRARPAAPLAGRPGSPTHRAGSARAVGRRGPVPGAGRGVDPYPRAHRHPPSAPGRGNGAIPRSRPDAGHGCPAACARTSAANVAARWRRAGRRRRGGRHAPRPRIAARRRSRRSSARGLRAWPAASCEKSSAIAGRPKRHGPHCCAPCAARKPRIAGGLRDPQPAGASGTRTARRPVRPRRPQPGRRSAARLRPGPAGCQLPPYPPSSTAPPARPLRPHRQDAPGQACHRDLVHPGSRDGSGRSHQAGARCIGLTAAERNHRGRTGR